MGIIVPDEYDDFRRKLTNYEKGLYFELGRARICGETPERGWVRQFTLQTDLGPRVLDSASTDGKGTRGVERKSGRISDRETKRQLDKERDGLETGKLTQSRWETVAGEKIPEQIRQDLRDMARDFGDRFQHIAVSREDALRAIKLGQSLVSQQLELVRAYELDRADRARQRLAKIREIVPAKEKAERFQQMQKFRDGIARGREEAPRRLQAERALQAREQAERAKVREAPENERARVEREAAERVAREFLVPSQLLGREATDGGEGVHDKARAEREAVEKAREQPGRAREPEAAERVHQHREAFAAQRERAERAGILDSVRIVQLQWDQPGEQRQTESVDEANGADHRYREEARERERVAERERQRTLGREPD
ncbi:hypothetical protein [Nocardia sp. NPDC057440]|uniref:hypothetical protein n=1 Tax=Nocardia sp. NPDC057440 TaxID=3346134 RepID=UPI00366F3D3C